MSYESFWFISHPMSHLRSRVQMSVNSIVYNCILRLANLTEVQGRLHQGSSSQPGEWITVVKYSLLHLVQSNLGLYKTFTCSSAWWVSPQCNRNGVPSTQKSNKADCSPAQRPDQKHARKQRNQSKMLYCTKKRRKLKKVLYCTTRPPPKKNLFGKL